MLRRYNAAARAGLAAAADVAAQVELRLIQQLTGSLATRLREGLRELPGLTITDAPPSFDDETAARLGASRCAIVCFECVSAPAGPPIPAEEIKESLAARQIGVSVSPPCHTFDDAAWARPASLRLSPHYFNTEAEVDLVVRAVGETLAAIRTAGC